MADLNSSNIKVIISSGEEIKVTVDNYVSPDASVMGIFDRDTDGVIDYSGATVSIIEANENIPAYSVITTDGAIADSTNISHIGKVLGVSLESVNSGQPCKVAIAGYVTNPNWNFIPNITLFLNGTVLAASPSISGFVQVIGKTITSNIVCINIQAPIKL